MGSIDAKALNQLAAAATKDASLLAPALAAANSGNPAAVYEAMLPHKLEVIFGFEDKGAVESPAKQLKDVEQRLGKMTRPNLMSGAERLRELFTAMGSQPATDPGSAHFWTGYFDMKKAAPLKELQNFVRGAKAHFQRVGFVLEKDLRTRLDAYGLEEIDIAEAASALESEGVEVIETLDRTLISAIESSGLPNPVQLMDPVSLQSNFDQKATYTLSGRTGLSVDRLRRANLDEASRHFDQFGAKGTAPKAAVGTLRSAVIRSKLDPREIALSYLLNIVYQGEAKKLFPEQIHDKLTATGLASEDADRLMGKSAAVPPEAPRQQASRQRERVAPSSQPQGPSPAQVREAAWRQTHDLLKKGQLAAAQNVMGQCNLNSGNAESAVARQAVALYSNNLQEYNHHVARLEALNLSNPFTNVLARSIVDELLEVARDTPQAQEYQRTVNSVNTGTYIDRFKSDYGAPFFLPEGAEFVERGTLIKKSLKYLAIGAVLSFLWSAVLQLPAYAGVLSPFIASSIYTCIMVFAGFSSKQIGAFRHGIFLMMAAFAAMCIGVATPSVWTVTGLGPLAAAEVMVGIMLLRNYWQTLNIKVGPAATTWNQMLLSADKAHFENNSVNSGVFAVVRFGAPDPQDNNHSKVELERIYPFRRKEYWTLNQETTSSIKVADFITMDEECNVSQRLPKAVVKREFQNAGQEFPDYELIEA